MNDPQSQSLCLPARGLSSGDNDTGEDNRNGTDEASEWANRYFCRHA